MKAAAYHGRLKILTIPPQAAGARFLITNTLKCDLEKPMCARYCSGPWGATRI